MAALLGEGEKWPNFRTDGQSQRQGHNIIGAHRARTEFFRIALKKNEDNAYLTILVQLTTQTLSSIRFSKIVLQT